MKVKGKVCLAAQVNLNYTRPGAELQIEVQKFYEFQKDAIGKIRCDDYDGAQIILAVAEVEIEVPPEFENLTSDQIMVAAFSSKEEKLRAEFSKAITENQARLQTFLALPNNAQVVEAQPEPLDDDLPF